MKNHYSFETIEKQMQEFWESEQIYKFDQHNRGEIYSIDTPPPTVSGNLHIGHIFSYTQAEMIARFRRMQGYNVFYPFGFDDNGLPTERLVERDEGIIAKNMPRSEFIEKCIYTTAKYEKQFKDMWKSLGFSVDWALQYETVSPTVRKISQELFLELAEQGKAYSKESPVLWCTECQTSIAQAELDTKDIDSTFNYVPFTVDGDIIEVATTRPELLYGCVCLFVNPTDKRYTKYIGKSACVPLYDYDVPIMTDKKVSLDKGTGAVMCATFGDSTDVEWATEYNLPYRKIILPNGYIDDSVPFIGGMKAIAARKEVIMLLSQNRLLLKSESITHTVAVHERCGKEIEIIPSRQWYIDVLSEKERLLKAANEINWYPEQMKNRYIAWVANLKWDWCISRQRYFGIPFPVWYCKNCEKVVFAGPEQLPVNPLETEYEGTCECGCSEFIPESAVLDTWATSSVTPQINERFGTPLVPMSMRAQAHEIIRTWTFYTIVRSLYHTEKLPWKDIMISGFVLAKRGEKIRGY
jgi:valyl-tRNA synthetase